MLVDTVAKLPREHVEERPSISVNGGRPARVGWRRHSSQGRSGGLAGRFAELVFVERMSVVIFARLKKHKQTPSGAPAA